MQGKPDMAQPCVMTVAGPIAPEDLGQTLIHEHVHVDCTPILKVHGYPVVTNSELTLETAAEARWNPGGFPDNYRLTDVELIIQELKPLYEAGGRALVDCTPRGLGRNPQALQEISKRSGLHVVMGSGYYLEMCQPPQVKAMTSEAIAQELVDELRGGVDGSGIRPGIIGEIGTGDPMTAEEQKSLRGAAWAQKVTGWPLTVHIHPWGREGTKVATLLEEEQVDPARVILNHTTTAIHDEAYQLNLLDRGFSLAYDLFGFDHSLLGHGRYPPSDLEVAARIADLARRGYLRQLLVSHDIGVRTRLLAYSGWGYAHIHAHIVPLLVSLGLSRDDIGTLLVENPRKLLTIDAGDARGPAQISKSKSASPRSAHA